jgi:hypothetical protein
MESIHLGTAHLSDAALVEEFESCRLPSAQFHHADHIRLAWVYLAEMSAELATARIERAILRFAEHNGISQKYHRTITVAWMRLVATARNASPNAACFEEFVALHPELLDVKNLSRYYTAERLAGAEARAAWLEPDILGLP